MLGSWPSSSRAIIVEIQTPGNYCKADLVDQDHVLNYVSSLKRKIEVVQKSSTLLLEDLVVGLLVDTVRDLLVVLVAEASLVSGVVNLCIRLLV
jgi:hypothetical protein